MPDYSASLTGDVRNVRVGVPSRLVESGVDPEVNRAFKTALDTLASKGATLVDIELPNARYAIAVYYLVATAEASSNLARYDGVRYGLRVEDDSLLSMYRKTRGAGFEGAGFCSPGPVPGGRITRQQTASPSGAGQRARRARFMG